MNERWVCKRCFADNDDSSISCANCGLTRGAEWAGADDASQPSRSGWTRYRRFLWVPLGAVVLAVGYLTAAHRDDQGALTTAGTVDVEELQIGDCFTTADEVEISEVHGVPCDEAHEYEVFAVDDYGADNAAYPSDAEMDAVFASVCEPAFESYVNAPYDTSAIYGSMITPSEESWRSGDREFICILFEPTVADVNDNVVLTESLRGAGR